MGITNFPNGVGSFGVPVLPSGADVATGSVFFVGNSTAAGGSDGNAGTTPAAPLATVDAAIGKCTAGKGDRIYVLPGHAETVTATSIAHDVSMVSIIGLGTGVSRPVFTFSTAAATITVSAAGGAWVNCHFIGNFLDVGAAFTLGAAKDFRLDACTFIDNTASLGFLSIVVTNSTNNAADGLTVTNCMWQSLDVSPNAFISILGNLDRLYVADNYVDMAATNDVGHFITVAALVIKAAQIRRNSLNVVGSTGAAVGIFMTGSSTTNTGIVANNFVASLDTTAALFITAALNLMVMENYVSGAIASSGTVFPAADAPS